MIEMRVGDWTVEVDRAATEAAYAEIADGAEECACGHCQHWAAHRDETVPTSVRRFLASLGIDYRRESEVFELDPRPSSHSCAGWYHFVGRVVSGPPATRRTSDEVTQILLPGFEITDGFFVRPHAAFALMKPAIRNASEHGLPIVTLDFDTTLHRIRHEFP